MEKASSISKLAPLLVALLVLAGIGFQLGVEAAGAPPVEDKGPCPKNHFDCYKPNECDCVLHRCWCLKHPPLQF
ncbi:hypothetical protein Tsubulata_031538 [Turnera subulata]|uniref:Uncharacterized protein n=1 Tax=Turnera subulata TaxID=218843 RepID=A0A9Q0J5C7_9ROSI|nr:hypothetical protein Tsubulata_031538 [Turnera subulata]